MLHRNDRNGNGHDEQSKRKTREQRTREERVEIEGILIVMDEEDKDTVLKCAQEFANILNRDQHLARLAFGLVAIKMKEAMEEMENRK